MTFPPIPILYAVKGGNILIRLDVAHQGTIGKALSLFWRITFPFFVITIWVHFAVFPVTSTRVCVELAVSNSGFILNSMPPLQVAEHDSSVRIARGTWEAPVSSVLDGCTEDCRIDVRVYHSWVSTL